jgi:hypothetical protein
MQTSTRFFTNHFIISRQKASYSTIPFAKFHLGKYSFPNPTLNTISPTLPSFFRPTFTQQPLKSSTRFYSTTRPLRNDPNITPINTQSQLKGGDASKVDMNSILTPPPPHPPIQPPPPMLNKSPPTQFKPITKEKIEQFEKEFNKKVKEDEENGPNVKFVADLSTFLLKYEPQLTWLAVLGVCIYATATWYDIKDEWARGEPVF